MHWAGQCASRRISEERAAAGVSRGPRVRLAAFGGAAKGSIPGAKEREAEEAVDVARLPAWMRAPASATSREVKPAGDPEPVDEELDVARLPAWMRSARPPSVRRAHWHRRRPEREPPFFADESPVMEVLPAWMTWGWQGGPAPPGEAEAVDWELVDPPSPEGFVDPQYDDEAYFN